MHPQRSPQPSSAQADGGNATIRAAIMAVVAVVFAGCLVLLVMMPTNAYKQTWLPELRAQTTTTYFGTNQGLNSSLLTHEKSLQNSLFK